MVAPTSAIAAQQHADAMTAAAPSQSVAVISGGVGEHEMDVLKSVENQYTVKLILTEKNGVYLSGVGVKITDAKGATIVDTVTKGPLMLAALPVGAYQITAVSEGESKEQKITVTDKGLKTYQIGFRSVDTRVDPPTNSAITPVGTPSLPAK
jgi:hypothetical protein